MKPFFLAASMLVLALVFCLWNAGSVTRRTLALEALVSDAEVCAGGGDWDGANAAVDRAYGCWLDQQTYFHIVMQHEALDETESLFRRLRAFENAPDDAEFCADAAELLSQLALLRELEEISIKNIL